MANPLVPIPIWLKDYQNAIWYDGTNLAAVQAYNQDPAYIFGSVNATTKAITWLGTQGIFTPNIIQPVNTWILGTSPTNMLDDAALTASFIRGPMMGWYDVLKNVEVGNVKLPLLALGVPSAPQVITLSGDMGSTDYSVKLIPGSTLLGSSTVNITSKTSTTVTLTVTASGLISAGATLTLICVR